MRFQDYLLIGIPAACLFTSTFIGVAACVIAGRSDELLEDFQDFEDVTAFCVAVPEATSGQADLSRTSVPSAPQLQAVQAVPFLDGDRVTAGTEQCVCSIECEFPCWMRLGMTSRPCCRGCAPLPDPTDESAAPRSPRDAA